MYAGVVGDVPSSGYSDSGVGVASVVVADAAVASYFKDGLFFGGLSLGWFPSQGFEFSGVVFPKFHEARVVFGDCLAAFQDILDDAGEFVSGELAVEEGCGVVRGFALFAHGVDGLVGVVSFADCVEGIRRIDVVGEGLDGAGCEEGCEKKDQFQENGCLQTLFP